MEILKIEVLPPIQTHGARRIYISLYGKCSRRINEPALEPAYAL